MIKYVKQCADGDSSEPFSERNREKKQFDTEVGTFFVKQQWDFEKRLGNAEFSADFEHARRFDIAEIANERPAQQ